MQNTINLASESASDVSTKKHSKNSKSKDLTKNDKNIGMLKINIIAVKTHKRNKTSRIPEKPQENENQFVYKKDKKQPSKLNDEDHLNDSIKEDILEESPVRQLEQTPISQIKSENSSSDDDKSKDKIDEEISSMKSMKNDAKSKPESRESRKTEQNKSLKENQSEKLPDNNQLSNK